MQWQTVKSERRSAWLAAAAGEEVPKKSIQQLTDDC